MISLHIATAEPHDLAAHACRGREGIGELYRFDVTVSTAIAVSLVDEWMGQVATLRLEHDGASRSWHGVVARVKTEGARKHAGIDRFQYVVRLVPRAWLLTRSRTSRVFQDMRIDEVLRDVCASALVATRFDLTRRLPRREYVTQYTETSWQLVKRLAAEAGLFWYFRQLEDGGDTPDDDEPVADATTGTTLAFSDDARSYRSMRRMTGELGGFAPTLHLHEFEANASGDSRSIRHASRRLQVAARTATFAAAEPDRPDLPIVTSTDSVAWEGKGREERSGDGPDRVATTPEERLGLDVYEHDSGFLFPSWSDAQDEAVRILRSARRRCDLLRGASRNLRLTPARTFAIQAYPANDLEGLFAVATVEHRATDAGGGGGSYDNDFGATPSDVTLVPARPARRPREVALTATVVGPPGRALHVDDRGRIQVKFHWDRRPQRERTTCWLRVMQPWALPHAGHQFLPRVGTEVLVVFEGGDPDKPLVLGGLHSAVAPMPFSLPEHQNVSGIRTHTVGGEGHSELSFDDTPGRERVHLRSQHRLDVHALESRTARVGGSDHLHVNGERVVHARSEHTTLDDGRKLEVTGLETRTIHGSSKTTARDAFDVDAGNIVLTGRAGAALQSFGEAMVSAPMVMIDGTVAVSISGLIASVTSGLLTRIGSDKAVEIVSPRKISLEVGASKITIDEESITIDAPSVFLNGKRSSIALEEEKLTLAADAKIAVQADKTTLASKGAAVVLDGSATIESSAIALKSGTGAAPSSSGASIEPTKVRLVDQDGNGVPNAPFAIVGGDGKSRHGRLDERGEAVLYLEGSQHVVFPEHHGAEG